MANNFYASYPVEAGGGGSGVSSVNGLTGAVILAAGTGISITPSGNTLTIANTESGGTVTSVGLALPSSVFTVSGSPVTTSGTLTGAFASQSANFVFAAPNGSSGVPSFRALVSADIPTLPYISTTLGATATSGGLTVSGNTLSAAKSSGSQNGWLSSTDWITFNSKQSALTFNLPLVDTTNVVSLNELLPVNSETVYVSKAGNDTTGNGSPTSPFLTIGKAFSVITDSTISKAYVVEVGGGVFTETNLTFPVWTFLKGSGIQATSIIDTSGNINLASSGFSSGSQRAGMQDLRLRQTNLVGNLQSVGGSGSDQFYLNNVQVDQAVTIMGRGGDASTIVNCKIFGTYTNSAMSDLVISTVFAGAVIDNDSGSPGTSTYTPVYISCEFLGNVTISAAGPSSVNATITGSPVFGTLTVSGSTATLAADSTTIGSSVTTTSGGSFTRISNAYGTGYTPTTSSNWNTVPTYVTTALDDLASSGIYKSQSANQFLASPNGSSGLPSFRAIVAADIPALPYTYVTNYIHTLNSTDITNKYITLSTTPTAPTVALLTVVGGPMQSYGTDYTVSGNQLSWSGLFLDGVLVSGDILIVESY
jgi:hypothetical protein